MESYLFYCIIVMFAPSSFVIAAHMLSAQNPKLPKLRVRDCFRYYAASILVLGILLALQSNYPATRSWNGLYINITVVVVLSEKVSSAFQLKPNSQENQIII
jgi:hypothetical protein